LGGNKGEESFWSFTITGKGKTNRGLKIRDSENKAFKRYGKGHLDQTFEDGSLDYYYVNYSSAGDHSLHIIIYKNKVKEIHFYY
jgi:hypothetical protein